MANIIQIKRSTGTTAPTSLNSGELAYTYGTGVQGGFGDRLFFGEGSNVQEVIGGKYFMDMLDHAHGTATAGSALISHDTSNSLSVLRSGTNATAAGQVDFLEGTNNGTAYISIVGQADTGSNKVLTLPNATDQLIGRATTDTLTAKSIDLGDNPLTGTIAEFNVALQSESFATLGGAETISGVKTFTGVPIIPEIDSGANILLDATADIILDAGGSDILLHKATALFGGFSSASNELVIKSGSSGTTAATFAGANVTLAGNITSVGTVTSTGDITSGGEFVIGSSAVNATELGILEGATVTTAELNDLAGVTDGTVSASKALVVDGSKDLATLGQVTLTTLKTANLTAATNIISTTAGNTDIKLDPHGTGDVDVSNANIINVATPTQTHHAVTKAYVDAVKVGLDIKDSVDIATTVDVSAWTYANGSSGVGATLTAAGNGVVALDGVNLTLNMRVLVKNQSPATENGIYYVSTAGAVSAILVLTRALDADEPAELTGGSFTFVEQGTIGSENGYVFTHNGTPTFGAGNTNLTVSQFSGAGQVIAGAGLTKSANTIDVVGTANRITVNADTIDIHASYAGQNTIATLGTITAGVWNSSTNVDVAYGGTGVSAFTTKGILYGQGGSDLLVTAAGTWDASTSGMGQIMSVNSSGVPTWTNTIDGGTF